MCHSVNIVYVRGENVELLISSYSWRRVDDLKAMVSILLLLS